MRQASAMTAAGLACCVAAAAGAAPSRRHPFVEARVIDGARGARVVVSCRDAGPSAALEVDGASLVPFGARPLGARAALNLVRKDGVIACVDDGARAAWRVLPLRIRAVTPRLVQDAAGARVVVTIDGVALGPRAATDDDVYFVWRGAIVSDAALSTGACPEEIWRDDRVVVCVDPARVRGRGPARLRVQAAGRLEEAAGAPFDLDRIAASPAR